MGDPANVASSDFMNRHFMNCLLQMELGCAAPLEVAPEEVTPRQALKLADATIAKHIEEQVWIYDLLLFLLLLLNGNLNI